MTTKEQTKLARQTLKDLRAIDWTKFWREVAAKTAPEIEAYRQARCRSLAKAMTRVLD